MWDAASRQNRTRFSTWLVTFGPLENPKRDALGALIAGVERRQHAEAPAACDLYALIGDESEEV